MGKGSKPRPLSVDANAYADNWASTFGKKKSKTIYVDIDGTICDSPKSDYANSKPITERIKVINDLFEAGNTIIYWTARGATTGIDWGGFTKSQLDEWGCKYTRLIMNKPHYDLWIDDKAWNDMDYFAEAIYRE